MYKAAILKYLGAEVLELDGNAAKDNKNKHIIPCNLHMAIFNDEDISKLLKYITHSHGEVLPGMSLSKISCTFQSDDIEKNLTLYFQMVNPFHWY